jgi:hypothetical protein
MFGSTSASCRNTFCILSFSVVIEHLIFNCSTLHWNTWATIHRKVENSVLCAVMQGRDSSVSIVTHYELDHPGIEPWWGRDFPHPSRPALRPTQPPVQWVPRGEAAGVWRWPSTAEVNERVALYLYSTSWPLWPVLWITLPLPLPCAAMWKSMNSNVSCQSGKLMSCVDRWYWHLL